MDEILYLSPLYQESERNDGFPENDGPPWDIFQEEYERTCVF